jgi:glycosyltransferase involved in cell wall biosynthesis/GT2 family glycosyltransferase
MTGAILASIVIPTRNAGPLFVRVLESLADQELDGEWELIVVDSGSTDATRDRARGAGARVHAILPGEFDHGATRNLGALLSRGEYVLFLSQDAVPARRDWLRMLLCSLRRDERVAGAYSRVVPLPDADPFTRRLVTSDLNYREERIVQEICPDAPLSSLSPHARRLLCNFNDVASAMRRSVWEELPLPRSSFGEDLLWGKGALEAGYRLVFEAASVVEHSHDYDARTLHGRAVVDGRANRRILDRICLSSLPAALVTAWRLASEDRRSFHTEGLRGFFRRRMAIKSVVLRVAQMVGLWQGGRRSEPLLPTPRPVVSRPLRILFVVHGFPPQTRAGTEVYTLNLARELRRKHEVVVFHRIEDPRAANYSLSTSEFEGIPVYRLVNNLRYQGIEETFENRHAEAKFREVLDTVRPDVVHFQHCLHISVSLIDVVAEAGLPAVLTLHDYWFICPKVQLIQTGGKVCPETKPGVGCVRCAANKTALVRLGKTAAFAFYPLLVIFLRVYPRLVARAPFLQRRVLLDLVALSRRRRSILSRLSRLDAMIAPSPFLRDKYLRFGVAPDRLILSRNGVDVSHLSGVRKKRGDRVRFAFMGSFVWYKGLEVLVRAFDLMEQEAELHVYGDDSSNPEVRAFKESVVGRSSRPGIHYHGRFTTSELPAIYATVDALVVPSIWYENAPMVIFEAFATGTPVIASRLGGMANFVDHEGNGLLFRSGDAADLARQMDRCVVDKGLLTRLAAAVPEVKTVEENAAELEVLYRQASGRRAKAVSFGGRRIPDIDLQARSHTSTQGNVELQGDAFVLLRPNGSKPSRVGYRVRAEAGGGYVLEVRTVLLEGERGVRLGGRVSVNGREAGRIPEHGYQPGSSLERRFEFRCALRSGENLVEIENGSPTEGLYVRLVRVCLYRETEVEATR